MVFLCFFLLLTVMLAVAPSASAEGARVAFATDLHYISPRLTDRGAAFTRLVSAADGKVMLYSEELLSAFIAQVLEDRPTALILAGDLTFNGAVESHEDLAARLAPLRDAGIRLFVLPGNHDVNYPYAARFSGDGYTKIASPSSGQFAEIWRGFGRDAALSRDTASLSYVAELVPSWRLLMLDVNTDDAPGSVKEETVAWAARQLAEARAEGCRVLSVSHQTLLRHNSLFEDGFRMANAASLLSALEGESALHLSGHMHIQHIAQSPGGLTEITCSALSVAPCQYGLLELGDDAVSFRNVKTEVSRWARSQGLSDPNLLDFTGYALSFFASSTLRQAAAQLKGVEGAEKALLWMVNTNIAYFSGRLQNAKGNEEAFRLLLDKAPFWAVYFKSFQEDLGHDYTAYAAKIR